MPRAIPVTHEGVEYRSFTELAASLGYSKQHVAEAFKRNSLSRIGTKNYSGRGVPCRWAGKTYPTIRAASVAAGVRYSTFWEWIEKGMSE